MKKRRPPPPRPQVILLAGGRASQDSPKVFLSSGLCHDPLCCDRPLAEQGVNGVGRRPAKLDQQPMWQSTSKAAAAWCMGALHSMSLLSNSEKAHPASLRGGRQLQTLGQREPRETPPGPLASASDLSQ